MKKYNMINNIEINPHNVKNLLKIKTKSTIKVTSVLKHILQAKLTSQEELELGVMLDYHYNNGIKDIYSIVASIYKQNNDGKCINCLIKAVSLNDYYGNYDLAICYIEGIFTNKDYKKAYSLLQESKNTIIESYYYLGLMFKEGLGVKRDYEKSLEYFNKIDNDITGEIILEIREKTLNEIADMYIKSLGVEQNIQKAFQCYIKAISLLRETPHFRIIKSTCHENLRYLKEQYKEIL